MFSRHLRFIIASLLIGTSGCASMMDSPTAKNKGKKKDGWSWFKKAEYQEPKSMIAIWTEDTLVQPGKPITRGFGGRLYFYNEKSQAIPVDGELVVYGFDESLANANVLSNTPGSEADLVRGGKKFRFTPEQFTQHFSQSELGASYSVWIPWDAVGGEQKKITLMPTFITKEQRVVRGESSKLVLSGKVRTPESGVLPPNGIQLASAQFPAVEPQALAGLMQNPAKPTSASPNPSPMNVTTIRMPHPIQGSWMPPTNTAGNALVAGQLTAAANAIAAGTNVGMANSMLNATATNSSPIVAAMAANPGQTPLSMAYPNLAPTMPQEIVNAPIAGSPVSSSTTHAVGMTAGDTWRNTIPPLGHFVPPTTWMKEGMTNGATSPALIGSPPNQSLPQGLPVAR